MPAPVGDNTVREHRRLAGLTQVQLATAGRVSRQSIVSIERGDYAPSVYLALRLAAALGTTVETLFPLPELEETR
ncbi:putative transcriptional regulator [Rhodococcus sp. 27YEA15]|uniref:helix-turn-helix transcriptional regulator n=1 Tax=Rhodococcus sp. 27YEA15 TaxID=3156259 RepID=UPI003C7A2838